jgi:hypothetical protein
MHDGCGVIRVSVRRVCCTVYGVHLRSRLRRRYQRRAQYTVQLHAVNLAHIICNHQLLCNTRTARCAGVRAADYTVKGGRFLVSKRAIRSANFDLLLLSRTTF